jgi:hypothetical protein
METFVYQGDDSDELFEASYDHEDGSTCTQCARSRVVQRAARGSRRTRLHYGNIAPGNYCARLSRVKVDKGNDSSSAVLKLTFDD